MRPASGAWSATWWAIPLPHIDPLHLLPPSGRPPPGSRHACFAGSGKGEIKLSKLTKAQRKAHNEACAILTKDKLTESEREFVIENWHEGATHMNGAAGAFFTPLALAWDFALDGGGHRVIDLCAGIGTLSYCVQQRGRWHERQPEITCIEINPAYVEVGKKLLPEATWICADVFEWQSLALGHFDVAISNPPFGAVKRSDSAPTYRGQHFEYHVVDIASRLANRGTFILPQASAPFTYSGHQNYRRLTSGRGVEFQQLTGLYMEAGCGVDTAFHRDEWKNTAPLVEIVCIDFSERRAAALPGLPPVPTPTVPAQQLSFF